LSKPHTLNKRYPKLNNSIDNRRIHKFKLQKPLIGTIDRYESVAYDRTMKPLMAIKIQRKKPKYISMSLFPYKKNPNKVLLFAQRGNPFRIQVFYYSDRPAWMCITCRGDFIQIPEEHVKDIIHACHAYLKAIDVKGRVTYSGYRPALHETKS
jgi:hypothetical protein